MSMSASQARLIALKARQSNLEYHGQQINQERSILSQQVTDLYNSLLALSVPTPPSTSEFTKVEYSGTDMATPFSLGNIVPSGTNSQGTSTYTVSIKTQETGHYMQSASDVVAKNVPAQISLAPAKPITMHLGYQIEGNATNNTPGAGETAIELWPEPTSASDFETGRTYYAELNGFIVQIADYTAWDSFKNENPTAQFYRNFIDGTDTWDPEIDLNFGAAFPTAENFNGFTEYDLLDGVTYVVNSSNKATIITQGNIDTFFDKLADGTYRLKPGYTGVHEYTYEGGTPYDNASGQAGVIGQVGNNNCYTLEQAAADGLISADTMNDYLNAIKAAFPNDCIDQPDEAIKKAFGVYFAVEEDTRAVTARFFKVAELNTSTLPGDTTFLNIYEYIANGRYDVSEDRENCLLTFDKDGRITEIKIPILDANGDIVSYKAIPLEAKQTTDQEAYQDAFNQYEYDKYLYDKMQQEINTKTKIIQEQDRDLELKLTRLDNERKQITTEIDAVQKVIDENIEKSFKTFSG